MQERAPGVSTCVRSTEYRATTGARLPATVQLRLLPVALLLVGAATAIPVDFRSPTVDLISWSVGSLDFALNILLFVPLGAALSGRPRYVVVVASLLLSGIVELSQLVQAGRHAGPADVLANVCGGLLGAQTARLRLRILRIDSGTLASGPRLFLVAALFLAVAPLLAIAVPGKAHDFSNWDPTYRLAIADELTHDRTWGGALLAWAIYDRSFARDSIVDLAERPIPSRGGTILAQLPSAPLASWDDPAEEGSSGFREMDSAMVTRLYERLTESGTMSLLAWIRVKDLEQTGVERILTFSHDPNHRNFTLGQEGGVLEFRLRTPSTGLNGVAPVTRTKEVLEPGRKTFVAVTYDGFVSRVFVDGELVGRRSLAASAARFPDLHDAGLPLLLIVCAGSLSGVLLVWLRARQGVRLLVGCGAGLGVFALVWLMGGTPVWPVYPISPLWRIVPPLTGGVVVAFSLTAVASASDPEVSQAIRVEAG